MGYTPTVRIKSEIPGCENGLEINKADFNPDIHEIYEEPRALAREDIEVMTKDEILAMLPDADNRLGVAKLRELLAAKLFPDA